MIIKREADGSVIGYQGVYPDHPGATVENGHCVYCDANAPVLFMDWDKDPICFACLTQLFNAFEGESTTRAG